MQREQILVVAADLFARQGYAGTSMNEVALACGVSKAALYHYVADKYQLLVEITQGHVDRLRGLLDEPGTPGAALAPDIRLRALIVRFMQAYAGSQSAHRVLTEDVKFLRTGDRRRVLDAERDLVEAFAQAIAAVRPELADARLAKPLTMLLFGMMNWTFTWLRPDGPLDHAALTPVVTDLFFGGLGAVQAVGPAHDASADASTAPGSLLAARPPARPLPVRPRLARGPLQPAALTPDPVP